MWACDFLPVTDLLFRPLFASFVIALDMRRVVHVGATRHPTDAWIAQQLRGAAPFDRYPQYLIRDNDGKFGAAFARVAAASGITLLRTPPRAPRANAVCERFLGSVRRECRDQVLVLGERQLARVLQPGPARAPGRRPPSPLQGRPGAGRGRYARCPSWVACTIRIGAPRRIG